MDGRPICGTRAAAAVPSLVDHFVAEDNWAMAISMAQMVLREYEAGLATDPQGYAPLVEQAKARIDRLTAQADAAGAPTMIQPSGYARALVASSNPNPTPEVPHAHACGGFWWAGGDGGGSAVRRICRGAGAG
ncbi:hypothetical protein AB0J90_29050 [Micromonospora sp. NPDC049523]|uniref:hypothetical protein n=1 Tax=Micromonospora sp. NPDC049523 TaxID=3155921 RepID=UPI00342BA851